ncbi:hypothetical protein BKA62DRAFT_608330, partial [Auriculariales sp. MPI-PUGE-AT-0066]
EDADVFRAAAARLRAHQAQVRFEYDDQVGSNEIVAVAHRAAETALDEETPAVQQPDGPSEFDLPGMPLSGLSQRLAHQTIRRTRSRATRARRSTTAHLDAAREAVFAACGRHPSDRDLHLSAFHRDFRRETRQLLWRGKHMAHRCGDFFERMGPEWQHLAVCRLCEDTTDSFEHALMTCEDGVRAQVWRLAEQLWTSRGGEWPALSIGLVLGCGAVSIRNAKRKYDAGATRLFRILIAESAHLIWNLRCDRRIEHADDPDFRHAPQFVKSEFCRVIRSRFDSDHLLTNRRRYGNRALKRNTVNATWRGLFEEQ